MLRRHVRRADSAGIVVAIASISTTSRRGRSEDDHTARYQTNDNGIGCSGPAVAAQRSTSW